MKKKEIKKIIILGGGYCGLKTFITLSKQLNDQSIEVILIDKGKKHICKLETDIIKKNNFKFLSAEVSQINTDLQQINLTSGETLNYDILVITLGSISNYFNIPGIEKNSYPLKTLSEADKIRENLTEQLLQHFKLNQSEAFRVVIGGGGFTGAEIACELRLNLNKIAKTNQIDPKKIEVYILQAIPEMIGLGQKVHQKTTNRLNKLGIIWKTNAKISAFENEEIKYFDDNLKSNQSLKPNFFIWTAGVKPNPIIESYKNLHKSGAIEVKPTLQSIYHENVFVGGDNAFIINPNDTQKIVPKTGQMAVQEGKIIAENILSYINNKSLLKFSPFFKGFVIQLGGLYALYCRENIVFGGILPYFIRKYVDLAYYLGIVSPTKAIKKWMNTPNIFLQND